MEHVITLKFDTAKLPKSVKNKSRDNSHSGKTRETGRVPRITRLMALAIHLQKLIDDGAVRDYSEIARLTGITRARVTQIMNLTLLSPEIQEDILFLPLIESGYDLVTERNIRKIASESLWEEQKTLWEGLTRFLQK